MFLIVGLGNPEKKYEKTFHNMGFLAVGEAAAKLGVKFKKKECEASVAEAFIGGEKVILARPVTYMNASGRAVKQLMAKYKVSPSELLVIYDDFDLPKGKLRAAWQFHGAFRARGGQPANIRGEAGELPPRHHLKLVREMAELLRRAEDYHVAALDAAVYDVRVDGGVAAAREHLLLDYRGRRRRHVRDVDLQRLAPRLEEAQRSIARAEAQRRLCEFLLASELYQVRLHL